MAQVTIYTTRYCPYCIRAKQLLKSKNVVFEEIPVDSNQALRRELLEKTGQGTVPQIWIGKKHIGGCTDLEALEDAGVLDGLLSNN